MQECIDNQVIENECNDPKFKSWQELEKMRDNEVTAIIFEPKTTMKEHLDALCFLLYTCGMSPPRLDLGEVNVGWDCPKQNCLLKQTGDYVLVLRKLNKVKKNESMEIRHVLPHKAQVAVEYSLAQFPRSFLLCTNRFTPLSERMIARALSKFDTNVCLIRKAYITSFNETNQSMRDRQELAKNMGHSVITSLKYYNVVSS